MLRTTIALLLCLCSSSIFAQKNDKIAKDPNPQQYILKKRASEIDPRAKPHPEIDFVFEKDGKPQDMQAASVDTRVAPQGRLVIWLMGHEQRLFDRLNKQGIHAIQVHYANKWFGILNQPKPKSPEARGNVRLEAAIGEDVSDEDFNQQLVAMNEELEVLNAKARELEQTIAVNVAEILGA